jgi:HEAT repeat protein
MIRGRLALALSVGLGVAIACASTASTASAHGAVVPPTPPGPYNGPGDVIPTPRGPSAPSGPSAPAVPTGGTGAPSPGTGGGSRGPATGGVARGGVATGEADPFGFATWEAWWHFNKDPFLELKRALSQNVRTSGADDIVAAAARGLPSREFVRQKIVPSLFALLEEDRAIDVTTGALVALARIGESEQVPEGESAIPRILRELQSPNQEVAETAALSLGILRSESGIVPLTDLLEDTEAGRKLAGDRAVDLRTRSFAAFGLGLAAERASLNRTRQLIARSLIAVLEDPKAHRDLQVAAVLALSLDRVDAEASESRSAPWISRQTILRKLFETFSDAKRNHLVRAHTATAIARLARDAPPGVRQEAVELFVDALKRPGRLENEVVNACAQSLGLLADTSKTVHDRAARATLVRLFDDPDPQARAFAMIGLAEIGARAPESAPVLGAPGTVAGSNTDPDRTVYRKGGLDRRLGIPSYQSISGWPDRAQCVWGRSGRLQGSKT